MHHPHYKKTYMSDMPYLKQRNHPSPMNRQTFTQPPTSKETAKPNEKSSSSGQSSDSLSSDSSTSSSNSNSDCSQSNKYKTLGIAELLPENKNSSPMIKGMDVMASESAKFEFDRAKLKYSSSEHVEHFRQIMIARGMDPLYAALLANRSDSGNSCSSSNSSESSSSPSSAVGTDTSNKLQWQLLLMIMMVTKVNVLMVMMMMIKENTEMKATTAKKAIRMMMTTRMIKETTEMKATAAKKAMRMMMTKRMAMTAMTPPMM